MNPQHEVPSPNRAHQSLNSGGFLRFVSFYRRSVLALLLHGFKLYLHALGFCLELLDLHLLSVDSQLGLVGLLVALHRGKLLLCLS